jgi:hypothetical protein
MAGDVLPPVLATKELVLSLATDATFLPSDHPEETLG